MSNDSVRSRQSRTPFRVVWGIAGAVALALLVGTPSARAQAAGEYGAAAGVSGGVVSSRPGVYSPGGRGRPNSSVFLAKPSGPTPQETNREWFAKEAGKDGAELKIDAAPPNSSVWVDGKYVGEAPVTLTLSAGRHKIDLMGTRQQQAKRDVEITKGKNQRIRVVLPSVYPSAVSIRVFGDQSH